MRPACRIQGWNWFHLSWEEPVVSRLSKALQIKAVGWHPAITVSVDPAAAKSRGSETFVSCPPSLGIRVGRLSLSSGFGASHRCRKMDPEHSLSFCHALYRILSDFRLVELNFSCLATVQPRTACVTDARTFLPPLCLIFGLDLPCNTSFTTLSGSTAIPNVVLVGTVVEVCTQ